MKILHISPSYKPANTYGGPTISIAILCETLAAAKYDSEVMTTTANGKTELQIPFQKQILVDGVKVRYFKRITKDHTHFSPSLIWNLYYSINKKNANIIIHIHSWWNLVSIFSCLLARFKNIPVILSPRGMLTPYSLKNRNSFLKLLIHHLIGKSLISYCHIHATSKTEEQDILQIQKPKSITIIPNFADLQPAGIHKKPSSSVKPFKTLNLLFLSRIEQKKGLEILFQALVSCTFPWKLTIAGTGQIKYINKLKRLIQLLGISQSVNWIGHINNDNKYKILANHDLLTLFSYNENFANVIIESLSTGTPVAISNKVGLAQYVDENDLGWVSEQNSISITKTLNNAFHDLEKRKRINKNAPILIKQHFSTQTILAQYIALYKNSNEQSKFFLHHINAQ